MRTDLVKTGIENVVIKILKRLSDQRGYLVEIFRGDEDLLIPVMAYVSHTNFGFKRGPHEHREQTDFFIFLGPGDFELYLWDNNPCSRTYGNAEKIVVGETNPASVIVPPRVVHGYKSISKPGSFCINLPDRLYRGKNRKEEVDEVRHEDDPNSPFRIK